MPTTTPLTAAQYYDLANKLREYIFKQGCSQNMETYEVETHRAKLSANSRWPSTQVEVKGEVVFAIGFWGSVQVPNEAAFAEILPHLRSLTL